MKSVLNLEDDSNNIEVTGRIILKKDDEKKYTSIKKNYNFSLEDTLDFLEKVTPFTRMLGEESYVEKLFIKYNGKVHK